MTTGGQRLRAAREKLELTFKAVEEASRRIAEARGDTQYLIQQSRLHEIEVKGLVPNIFRLFTLSAIYKTSYQEMLGWYGVDLELIASMEGMTPGRKTQVLGASTQVETVRIPVQMDPSFDIRKSTNIGRMIQQWGVVPMTMLSQLASGDYTYGYIGTEDLTMWPLLTPGSLVQVDETKDKVAQGMWRSEYERPIYLLESREGFTCAWCSVQGGSIVIQPHPLSPVQPKTVRYPQDAEVVGQVVGVAMRLDWQGDQPQAKERQLLI